MHETQKLFCQGNFQRLKKFQSKLLQAYKLRSERQGRKGVGKKRGRPRKFTSRDERRILRSLNILSKREGNFSSKRIITMAGLDEKEVSNKTNLQTVILAERKYDLS